MPKQVRLEDVIPKTARGERQGSAKLTAPQVVQIRKLYADGGTVMGIARAFGVTPPTIRSILSGTTWRHVTTGEGV